MALSPSPSPTRALLLALLCATSGLGAPGGGCGLPPSAWCQSWESALRCRALGRCALAWAPPDTDVCADCQQIVTLLIRMANESATKVAVEGFLRQECAALPVPTMVTPCQNLVHQYLSLLLTDIEGHLKPSAVCARLELCPGQPGGDLALSPLGTLSTHLQVSSLPVPMPLCWLCRTFLSRVKAAVPTERVAKVAAGLCRVLPVVLAGACQCLAGRYAALALEGLLGRVAPRLLCHLLLACREGDGPAAPPELAPPRRHREVTAAALAGCAGSEDPGQGHPVPALSPNWGPCALGPTYWCSSPAAARRCQALQHCQEHVWL
ncbi:pulmonary surfactant-associated protein B [Patagioenas fasciata]